MGEGRREASRSCQMTVHGTQGPQGLSLGPGKPALVLCSLGWDGMGWEAVTGGTMM